MSKIDQNETKNINSHDETTETWHSPQAMNMRENSTTKMVS
jgi:hypothetical protein